MKQKYSSSVNLKPADIHDCCVTDHQTSSFLFLVIRMKMRNMMTMTMIIDEDNNDYDDNSKNDRRNSGGTLRQKEKRRKKIIPSQMEV